LGYLIFVSISTILICFLLSKMLKEYNVVIKFLILVLSLFLSLPFILNFDRGNIQTFLMALLLLAIVLERKNKSNASAIILGIVIGIKVYPVVLLILPFFIKRYKYCVIASLASVIPNALLFCILPGGFTQNVGGWLVGLSHQTGPDLLLAGQSLSAGLLKVVYLLDFKDKFSVIIQTYSQLHLQFLPGILWCVMLVLVIKKAIIPEWFILFVLFASLQAVVPVSMPYVSSWATLGILVFLQKSDTPIWFKEYNERKQYRLSALSEFKLRWIVLITLLCILAPLPFSLHGFKNHTVEFVGTLSAILLTFCGVYAIIKQRDKVLNVG